MGILQIIGAVLKLIAMFCSRAMELDKEKKVKLKEAEGEVIKGIKNRDASAISAGFDRINRL